MDKKTFDALTQIITAADDLASDISRLLETPAGRAAVNEWNYCKLKQAREHLMRVKEMDLGVEPEEKLTLLGEM